MVLNSDIQGSFKKFSLGFGQAEMVFVVNWFLDHFTLEPGPSVKGVWIIAFVSQLHVWVTKFKTLLMVFQLIVLTSNNVVSMPFLSVFLMKHNTPISLRLGSSGLPLASLETLNKEDIFIITAGPGEVTSLCQT